MHCHRSLGLPQNEPAVVNKDVFNFAHGERDSALATGRMHVSCLPAPLCLSTEAQTQSLAPSRSTKTHPSLHLLPRCRAGPFLWQPTHARGERMHEHMPVRCHHGAATHTHARTQRPLAPLTRLQLRRPAPCHAHLPQFCNILGNPNTIGEPALQGGCGWFHEHYHPSPGWLGAHPPLVPHLPVAAHLAHMLSHPAQQQMTASSQRAIGSKESTRRPARSPAVSESFPTALPSPRRLAVGWGRS